MTKTQRLRMTIDITMTILSIILMGGNYLFPADIVHEILGVALCVLWAVHITLNRRWYGAIFRGKYNAYRVMQTIINCSILICTIFLMISGIILSNHLFTFLNIQSGLGFFPSPVLTVFTSSSPGESGSILFFTSSFSSFTWNGATFFLQWTTFQ